MSIKKVACVVCHSLLKNGSYTSADGSSKGGVNEYEWSKKFTPILAQCFRDQGIKVDIIQCPERIFTNWTQERDYKLSKINGKGYDLVIESHLNAYDGKARGTETLYYSKSNRSKAIAQRVNNKLDDIFIDREIKARDGLYILKRTDCPAILNEYFFCDSREDYMLADELHEMKLIAKKVVEGVLDITIIDSLKANINKNYCILYSNDADRVGAEIISWGIPNSTVLDIKDFKNNYWGVIAVGGKTETKLKAKYPHINFTAIAGTDRFNTVKKCLEYLR